VFAAGLLLVGWWTILAPVALGGPATFVVVHGRSMEPVHHAGDLLIARRGDGHAVGDVIVFLAPDGRRHVIHRIVAGDAMAGWITKGDANARVDPWSVPDDAIVGRSWAVLPWFGTAILAVQRDPIRFAAAVGGGVSALVLMTPDPPGRRRPGTARSGPSQALPQVLAAPPEPDRRLVMDGFDVIEARLAAIRAALDGATP